MKLGILVSHPIQYFVPVYRALSERPDVSLLVLYRTRMGVDAYYDPGFAQTVQWDIPLLDGHESHFLSNKTALTGYEPGIVKELLRRRFDVLIVHGYNGLTNLLAVLVAKLIGTRVFVRGDTRLQRHHLSAPFWKRLFKHFLFKMFDGVLAIGSLNRAYYAAFGVAEERIFFAPFCVDNAMFSLQAEELQIQRLKCRRTLGLPEDCTVVLYASKLILQKRPADLVRAFALVAPRFRDAWLVMAGSGEEEPILRSMVVAFGIERVHFIGFQNQSNLPTLYAASDVFVLPADAESWGLVLNEVMAAGLPVVVSDEVGAAADLVQGQGTGFVYPCGDVEALAGALESLLQSEALRLEMGKKARELIRAWDVDACASGIAAAVGYLT
ncbi:MAG: glycosyltransferase [bacterium]|uniref:Glycosyltransferase n=1 Tax=Candidatus Methylomirabilis tolerans TaxID=3123416 RepID=A0AAJ1EJ77_9BACT|nr:glycosyltransferase [Candidatus Methylomirabilis sp.]